MTNYQEQIDLLEKQIVALKNAKNKHDLFFLPIMAMIEYSLNHNRSGEGTNLIQFNIPRGIGKTNFMLNYTEHKSIVLFKNSGMMRQTQQRADATHDSGRLFTPSETSGLFSERLIFTQPEVVFFDECNSADISMVRQVRWPSKPLFVSIGTCPF